MGLRPSLGLVQRQRLGLTQEIKSSLQYLALAGLRLEQTLQDLVDSNPFLSVSNSHAAQDEADWMERLAAPLPDSLAAALRALAQEIFWRVEDRALANLLIDEVADTGLLSVPLAEVARPAGISFEQLADVRAAFLNEGGLLADHVGQSLLAQAKIRLAEGQLDPQLLHTITALCEGCAEAACPDKINAAQSVLRGLTPYPADILDLKAKVILPPDLIVEAADQGWAVRLNPLTHRTYDLDEDMLSCLTPATLRRSEVAEPLKAAKATVRALKVRSQTLLNLTLFLCKQQDAALRSGRAALHPLTQLQAAAALNLHASTVSRAVAGKTVQTPQGIWALKDFFTALIDPATGFSGAKLRSWLVRTITEEDPVRPKSDATLVAALGIEGITLARRTVTKYRLGLGLPGVAERRRAYVRRPSPAIFHPNRKDTP